MAHGWAKVLVIKPDMSLILGSHTVEGENLRELILSGCPLTSTYMPQCMHVCEQIFTHICTINK